MRTRLSIKRGERFSRSLRIETLPYVYVPITAVTQSAPVRITAPGHGLLDGQRAAIVSVRGMSELNARSMPPKIEEYRQATVIDADTIEFNAINGAAFRTHTSGGQLAWHTPVDLNLYVGARMNVRDKVGGALLFNWTTDTGELEIDVANDSLWLRLDDLVTETLTAKNKVFDIELIRTGGDADRVCAHDSTLVVLDETTTE